MYVSMYLWGSPSSLKHVNLWICTSECEGRLGVDSIVWLCREGASEFAGRITLEPPETYRLSVLKGITKSRGCLRAWRTPQALRQTQPQSV